MNKPELQTVVNELRNKKNYEGVSTEPLHGLALSDFEIRKPVRKEAIVNFLNWQCMQLNGDVDEKELTNCLWLLRNKRVVMI